MSALQAQKLYHALGMNYNQIMGAYGNSDIISVMYTPQLQWENKHIGYGFACPATIGIVSSSSREPAHHLTEIPISGEVSFNPGYPYLPLRKLSVFLGAGVSRIYDLSTYRRFADMANCYLGFRVHAIELRFNLSRSLPDESYSRLYRVGFGMSYVFK